MLGDDEGVDRVIGVCLQCWAGRVLTVLGGACAYSTGRGWAGRVLTLLLGDGAVGRRLHFRFSLDTLLGRRGVQFSSLTGAFGYLKGKS